jgi:hypothetical protein
LAGEHLWILRPKEVREMFLGGSLVLGEPADIVRLSSAAKVAWTELPCNHPEIVLTVKCDVGGKRLLEYRNPQNDNEVRM